jgi:tyrosinase
VQLIRRNVWGLDDPWAEPVLWYARGVAAMKARAIQEATSWRFYGAIHGIDQDLWKQLGYLEAGETLPNSPSVKRYWDQCQHGSWYFLPWHRGYLLAFEENVRAAIVALNGPKDWTLPYWNYFKAGQATLPTAFATLDWPDGKGTNPLFVPQRYGTNGDGKVVVPVDLIDMKALDEPQFTGVSSGGSPGFGGVDTGFEHGGRVHGRLERQPHDAVHGLVGGADPNDPNVPGLMSDPDTAGLDPIFWLHHANIDRLWEVWRQTSSGHTDPTASSWLKGPASVGERIFSLPKSNGEAWNYTPADMVDLVKLDYSYDDLAPAVVSDTLDRRMERLGAGPSVVAAARAGAHMASRDSAVELVGASRTAVDVKGSDVHLAVVLDKSARRKVTNNLTAAAKGSAPDRIFLNLENVTGLADATTFKIYVGVPKGEDPARHPDRLAGTVTLFGVRRASKTEGRHAGKGLTFVLEVDDLVDDLHLRNAFDVDHLDVRIVPLRPVGEASRIRIGRVSIFRQGR